MRSDTLGSTPIKLIACVCVCVVGGSVNQKVSSNLLKILHKVAYQSVIIATRGFCARSKPPGFRAILNLKFCPTNKGVQFSPDFDYGFYL